MTTVTCVAIGCMTTAPVTIAGDRRVDRRGESLDLDNIRKSNRLSNRLMAGNDTHGGTHAHQ